MRAADVLDRLRGVLVGVTDARPGFGAESRHGDGSGSWGRTGGAGAAGAHGRRARAACGRFCFRLNCRGRSSPLQGEVAAPERSEGGRVRGYKRRKIRAACRKVANRAGKRPERRTAAAAGPAPNPSVGRYAVPSAAASRCQGIWSRPLNPLACPSVLKHFFPQLKVVGRRLS